MGDDDQRPVLVAIGPHADIDAVLDAAEAERRRRVLRLVHVIARADAAEAGRLRLALAEERLRERLPTPARVETRLVTGAVVPSLVELGRKASLVVLQRQPHPRSRLATLAHLSGVAARAECPVLCVPPRWRRDILDARPVGAGIEPHPAPAVVRAALGVARESTGQLRLFCAPDAEIAGPDRDSASWAAHVDTVVRGRLGGVLEEQPEVDVEVAPWHGHLGPKVPRLLREVACPVLVVDPVEPVEPAGHPSTGAGRVQQREKR